MKWDLLIVEDDQAMAELLAELARDADFDARIAPDVDAARDQITRQIPDALFTDLRLPDGDGVQIIEMTRSVAPDAPTVLITGYAAVPDVVAAFRAGAFDLLTKPFEVEQITQVISKILAVLEERRHFEAALKRLDTLDNTRDPIVAHSPAMCEVLALAERVSSIDVPVMLTGETGTGKGLIARLIHDLSPRAHGPWFTVNCGAISATLAESELFGYEKGAFTGATQRKHGLLELADGGSLFLDEINSAPVDIQTRLLQFVQDHRLMRVGGQKAIDVDVRIIAAANQPLADAVSRGEFRQDLLFRLNVFPIEISPLRDRSDDILPIADQMLARCTHRLQCSAQRFSDNARKMLLTYIWPGNVRELENVIQRAAILCAGKTIEPSHLPVEMGRPEYLSETLATIPGDLTLAEVECLWIKQVLKLTNGNKTEAARCLGIDPSTLHRKLKE